MKKSYPEIVRASMGGIVIKINPENTAIINPLALPESMKKENKFVIGTSGRGMGFHIKP
jgi:hypothetical protein